MIKVIRLMASAVLALMLCGCAGRRAALLPEPVTWQPMGWLAASVDTLPVPRAALLVRDLRPTPVPRLFQLDFAGNGQRPTGFPERPSTPGCSAGAPKIVGLLASVPTGRFRIGFSNDTLAADAAEIGTLGLLSVALGVAVIDAPRHRFAVVPSLATAEDDRRRVRWTAVQVVDDRLVATIALPRGGVARALLDTGLLPVPALARPELWRRLTEREPDDPRNVRLDVPVCGVRLVVALAPATTSLRLGEMALDLPLVGVLVNAPADLAVEAWPEQVDLMLGAKAWLGRRMVLLDVRQSRIGLVRR